MSHYTPSHSSRSSSPITELDSSPPSSPSQSPTEPVVADVSSFSHPFAGSTRARFKFREYEKKPVPVIASDASSSGLTRYRSLETYRAPDLEDTLPGDEDVKNVSIESTISPADSSVMNRLVAKTKWEQVISDVVENPSLMNVIDLNGTYIGYIPRSISDLNKVVVLPQNTVPALMIATAARKFARAATSPLDFATLKPDRMIGRTGSLDRFKSTSFSVSAIPGELRFSLASCGIRVLPRELFRLDLLTSLDLRSNLLTFLPPQISQLKNLRELNLSTNRLKFLPSEMLDMTLISFQIALNDFLPKPNSPFRLLSSRVAVSKTFVKGSSVPSIQEYCYRVLFRTPDGGNGTNLQEAYTLPLDSHWKVPDNIRETLAACDPASVSISVTHKRARLDPHTMDEDDIPIMPMGISVCRAPVHSREGKPIFLSHVEERFTWETRIAGKDLMGVAVPVLWRGCSRGCLQFLDEDGTEGDETSEFDSEDGIHVVDLDPSRPLTFSDDEGMNF